MSSTEVLEANVASIRVDLNELKTDFRAAVARIDGDIKSAVTKLEGEIRVMAANAEKDLQRFADNVQIQFSALRTDVSDLRAEMSGLRKDVYSDIAGLRSDNKFLHEKIDRNFERLSTRFDTERNETSKALGELSKVVLRIDSRQSAILRVGGGLVALITLAVTVGKAFKWF